MKSADVAESTQIFGAALLRDAPLRRIANCPVAAQDKSATWSTDHGIADQTISVAQCNHLSLRFRRRPAYFRGGRFRVPKSGGARPRRRPTNILAHPRHAGGDAGIGRRHQEIGGTIRPDLKHPSTIASAVQQQSSQPRRRSPAAFSVASAPPGCRNITSQSAAPPKPGRRSERY